MSELENTDLSLLNTSCRILTLSSSLDQAIYFIQRVRDRTSGQPASTEIPEATSPPSDPPRSSSDSVKIPWTISNKYYSADVHFAAHTVHGLSSHQFQNVPALIFVWSQGEPYRHNVERIHQDMAGCEPDVCLAVKIERESSISIPDENHLEDDSEDDSETDNYLSSFGFEYIDATEHTPSRSVNEEKKNLPSGDIPRLPRVLDALSTIMWPSMRTNSKDSNPGGYSRSGGRGLLDWSQDSMDSLSTAEDIAVDSDGQLRDTKHEMRELARWLEEDVSIHQDPWISAATSGAISLSPTSIDFEDGISSVKPSGKGVTLGFDDDFTVFISAPAGEPVDASGQSTPDASSEHLMPLHAGDLYRSLGSVSDFGGSEDGKQLEEEAGLPTQDEIIATSSRIFGTRQVPSLLSREPTVRPIPLQSDTKSSVQEPGTLPSISPSDMDANSDGNSYGMAPFDLSKVLGALQEMKAEIATMEDGDERRHAAAKVALGLVYGLELDAGHEEH